MNETKIKAAGLWEKTSSSGNRYFVGRLGGVRILIFENRDRAGENEPTHHLFFAEAADKPRTTEHQQAAGSSSDARPPRRAPYRRRAAAPTSGEPGAPDPDLNDEIPF